MLTIKALERNAHLCLSEMTGEWYVSARIEISNGAMLSSICEHRSTPDAAVAAFLDELKKHPMYGETYIVVGATSSGVRSAYQFNGACFAAVTQVFG
jgi:hypothetical protein